MKTGTDLDFTLNFSLSFDRRGKLVSIISSKSLAKLAARANKAFVGIPAFGTRQGQTSVLN